MNFPIHLTTLLSALVSNDTTTFQRLDQSFVKGQTNRNELQVTFATEKERAQAILSLDGRMKESALIIWYPADKWDEVVKQLNTGEGTEAQRVLAEAKKFYEGGPIEDCSAEAACEVIQKLIKALEPLV